MSDEGLCFTEIHRLRRPCINPRFQTMAISFRALARAAACRLPTGPIARPKSSNASSPTALWWLPEAWDRERSSLMSGMIAIIPGRNHILRDGSDPGPVNAPAASRAIRRRRGYTCYQQRSRDNRAQQVSHAGSLLKCVFPTTSAALYSLRSMHMVESFWLN
jgi:hypothetical protein